MNFTNRHLSGNVTRSVRCLNTNFEKRTEGGVTYFRHYLRADGRMVGIKVRSSGVNENKSVLTDHLGSIVEILNDTGNVDVSENFAAFGERRDPSDADGPITNESAIADITQRGYTGHTHLDASALVHMGGRVMDSFIGRFLSPDPYVPHPDSTQSFNRYSYVQNNPLSATDPSGFIDIFYGGTISVSWGKRFNIYVPGVTKGCKVGSAVGCHGKAGAKSVVDVIFDQLFPPLSSQGRDDELILYAGDPKIFGGLSNDSIDRAGDNPVVSGEERIHIIVGVSIHRVSRKISTVVTNGRGGMTAAIASERKTGSKEALEAHEHRHIDWIMNDAVNLDTLKDQPFGQTIEIISSAAYSREFEIAGHKAAIDVLEQLAVDAEGRALETINQRIWENELWISAYENPIEEDSSFND